jgi:hypothetical protein
MEHPIRSRQRALSEIDQERYITEEREKRVCQFRIRNFQNDYNERLFIIKVTQLRELMKEVKKLGLKPYLPEKDMGNLLIEMAYESVERLFDKVLGRPSYNEKYY